MTKMFTFPKTIDTRVDRIPQSGKLIGEVQITLKRLGFDISRSDQARKEVGDTTKAAIEAFASENGLDPGRLDTPALITRLNNAATTRFVRGNKKRTRVVQDLLAEAGFGEIDANERRAGKFRDTTERAWGKFADQLGLGADDPIGEASFIALREAALASRVQKPSEVRKIHKMLMNALRIGGLSENRIAAEELRTGKIGDTTLAALRAFQDKYKLPKTGVADLTTLDRVETVSKSAGAQTKMLKARTADELTPLRKTAKLNQKGAGVVPVQQALAYMGYKVAASEAASGTFGKTTHHAVRAFQKANRLEVSGHVDIATRKVLNEKIAALKPGPANAGVRHRIRGSVRDDLWRGLRGASVRLSHLLAGKPAVKLAEKTTAFNGFFDVPYDRPADPDSGQLIEPFHLLVEAIAGDGTPIGQTTIFNPVSIVWANFTQGDRPYKGTSAFDELRRAMKGAVASGTRIADLQETDDDAQITRTAETAGTAPEQAMRVVLAYKTAAEIGAAQLTAPVIFGLLSVGQPSSLPSDMLGSTEGWTLIDQLVLEATNGLIFAEPEVIASAFDAAVEANLIPIADQRRRDVVLAELQTLRASRVLTEPLLSGNAALDPLIELSGIGDAARAVIAELYLEHGSFEPEFWADAAARAAEFGGQKAVDRFRMTVMLGEVTRNFIPALKELMTILVNDGDARLTRAADAARLSEDEWRDIIEPLGVVPDGTDGETPQDQLETYLVTLRNRAGAVFPETALFAELGGSGDVGLNQLNDVVAAFDKSATVSLLSDNLEVAFKREGIDIDAPVLAEAKVIQRVHRMAPRAPAARVLMANRIHNSSQVVSLGKERFAEMMTTDGAMTKPDAMQVYARAEWQYSNVLQMLSEYHPGFHRFTPNAVPGGRIQKSDLPDEAAGLANLEILFGSLDFCTCDHCESVYGPAAYFADVLRYLGEQRSTTPGRSVLDLLIGDGAGLEGRRPDLSHIKLDCGNTETVLPYIDLVLEVLESRVDAPNAAVDFAHQTTWTTGALRAGQEHRRVPAYERLRQVRFPMHQSLDLWNAEVRAYLDHLGVPRTELIDTLMTPLDAPWQLGDEPALDRAAERFGLARHELALVIAGNHGTNPIQRDIWGFDAAPPDTIPVVDFMEKTALDYAGVLDLLSTRWPSLVGAGGPIALLRPDATCDLTKQSIVNLTRARLDRLSRFLRLWRRSGTSMRDLDRMLRHAGLGGGALNADTLRALDSAAELRNRLGSTIDDILLFLGPLGTEHPLDLGDLDAVHLSPYEALFLNPENAADINPAFAIAALGGSQADQHKGTLGAVLGLSTDDVDRLIAILPNGDLTLDNISIIARHARLAQLMKTDVVDLLRLRVLRGGADIFASLATLRIFLDDADRVSASSYDVDTLDYVITGDENLPLALREEAITGRLHVLRGALDVAINENAYETVISWIGDMFGFDPQAARLIADDIDLGGVAFGDVLNDPALTAKGLDGAFSTEISPANFADAFSVMTQLHRISVYAAGFRLTGPMLGWLVQSGATDGLLTPQEAAVPLADPAAGFAKWRALSKLMEFSSRYPEPEGMSVRAIFDLAIVAANPVGDLRQAVADLTQWPLAEVEVLSDTLGINHGANSDFLNPDTYLRLDRLRSLARRIGLEVPAIQSLAAFDAADEPAKSAELRAALRSKYDEATFLDKMAGIEDGLREAKRDALLAYVVARSQRTEERTIESGGNTFRNPAYLRNAEDALNFLLIDVEMSSCQLTSRLKQAISSAQMYVQRCLLGLEQPFVEVGREELEDEASDNSWRQWTWMKTYRIWEANRKIFLYPENWIEPELRDDKSPFFKEFERELTQAELTEDHAEAALGRYLEKVEEVSQLEVVGTFRELDDSNPSNGLPPETSIVHVIGRTREQPHRYFYRAFDQNLLEWSPWERIDAEIEGHQAVPVIYNRKLYLFWLSIERKPIKQPKNPPAKETNGPQDSPELPYQLELRLAWSVRTKDGWQAKKQSAQKLIHPWPRPTSAYTIKPRYRALMNEMWVDIFITQSREFNSRKFWNSFIDKHHFMSQRNPWTPGAWPWHSSTFVFDGSVRDVRMKPLKGAYRLLTEEEVSRYTLTATDSHTFVQENFGEEGREIGRLTGLGDVAPRMPVPQKMNFRNGRLRNLETPGQPLVNVLERRQSHTLLRNGITPYEVVGSLHQPSFDTSLFGPVPFFYQDPKRAFFVRPRWRSRQIGYNRYLQTYTYDFYPFYNPYASMFIRELNRDGIGGLLQRRVQMVPQFFAPRNTFNFSQYGPTSRTRPQQTAQRDRLDFTREGAYSLYNWETFVHIPFTVAVRLSENQRFEEAMRWFHTIFDPTNLGAGDVPQRYWVSKPFYEMGSQEYRKQRIDNLLEKIEMHTGELRAWRNDPFKPYVIARFRPVALQKAIVMKYIDNIIAWADHLFRRDSIESINQATTLYLLANEILGRRPEQVPHVNRAEKSFAELTADDALDPFGNQKVEVILENMSGEPARVIRAQDGAEPLPMLSTFYFCIPNNNRLSKYWDTIADRLWKIRHCQNIEGVTRQLALFEPAIDPALLVKAAASGLDLTTIAAPSSLAMGPYKFRTLAGNSDRFIGSVRNLGGALLNALERRDSEEIAMLRAVHEVELRDAMREMRRLAIDEAGENIKALEVRHEAAMDRKQFYDDKDFMNAWEITSLTLKGLSTVAEISIAVGYALAGGLSVIPGFVAGASGFGGSPHAVVETPDGKALAKAAESAVKTIQAFSKSLDKLASVASTMGGYVRRQEEWDHSADEAEFEADRLEIEIVAAQIREALAVEESRILDLEIEHAQQSEEFLQIKYTNAQLYNWMVAQISSTYFQAYQLAFDMAKAAEAALQQELCDPAASFVQFGHWDSLKKGLLSGERLGQDLHRMESHYYAAHSRELELKRHVSLAELAPMKLLELKLNGSCTFEVPEWLYDMDHAGHFRRRLKGVSVTVPAVVGPYTNVNATLTLTNNAIRVSEDVAPGYGDPLAGGDARFLTRPVSQSAIATSHGRNDAGMFVFDFKDERFLPFEGAGAVSEWTLELPNDSNRFDLSTVSDVVLHVNYTAQRSTNAALADAARANIETVLPDAGVQMIDLRSTFGTEWLRFFVPAAGEDQELVLAITSAHLPFFLTRRGDTTVTAMDLVLDATVAGNFDIQVTPPGGAASDELATPEADFGDRPHMAKADFAPNQAAVGEWRIKIKRAADADFQSLDRESLSDAYLVFGLRV